MIASGGGNIHFQLPVVFINNNELRIVGGNGQFDYTIEQKNDLTKIGQNVLLPENSH